MKVYEKVISIIISAIVLLLLCGYCIQTYKLGQARNELELTRNQLSAANDKQSEIRDGLSKCIQSVRETETILSQSATTIGEIREQIRAIRENYQYMEEQLYSLGFNNDNRTGDYNNNDFVNDKVNGE